MVIQRTQKLFFQRMAFPMILKLVMFLIRNSSLSAENWYLLNSTLSRMFPATRNESIIDDSSSQNTKIHFIHWKPVFYRQIFYMFERRSFLITCEKMTHFEPQLWKFEKWSSLKPNISWLIVTSHFFEKRNWNFKSRTKDR